MLFGGIHYLEVSVGEFFTVYYTGGSNKARGTLSKYYDLNNTIFNYYNKNQYFWILDKNGYILKLYCRNPREQRIITHLLL